jgi:hypothetical protein
VRVRRFTGVVVPGRAVGSAEVPSSPIGAAARS